MGVSGSIFRLVADTLVEHGLAASAIEQHTDLPRAYWEDDWVEDSSEERLWELALTHLPDIGLRATQRLPRGTFRGLEYAFRSAPDVERAVAVLVRFQELLHGRRILQRREDGSITYRSPHDPPVDAAANELAIGILVRSVREIGEHDDGVVAVSFTHARPAHGDALAAYLGVEPSWSEPETSVTFSAEMLAARSCEADAVLHALMHEVVTDEMERVPERSWASRVREKLRATLIEGDPSLSAVARRLGTSERALQERLKDEGTSFREVLDQTRHVLAMRYLSRTSISISGIALMLGYAEQSTFQRAFKRWSGQTPARYRRSSRR